LINSRVIIYKILFNSCYFTKRINELKIYGRRRGKELIYTYSSSKAIYYKDNLKILVKNIMIILKSMIARMKAVFREEGLTSLLKRGFRYLVHRVFSQVIYYLNESPIQELGIDLDDFLPNIPDLTYQFIRTNREADEVANKFKDFRLYFLNSRERLDSGAIALCIYIGQEPAYICWIAMNESAKATFGDVPCHMDFNNREAFVGGEVTILKYRRKGIKTYGVHLRDLFLKEMGVTKKRSAISVRNDANLKATIGRKNMIYAKALYIKLFCWKFWKEVPISPPLTVEQVISKYK